MYSLVVWAGSNLRLNGFILLHSLKPLLVVSVLQLITESDAEHCISTPVAPDGTTIESLPKLPKQKSPVLVLVVEPILTQVTPLSADLYIPELRLLE
jgi:hypothetical protein